MFPSDVIYGKSKDEISIMHFSLFVKKVREKNYNRQLQYQIIN